MDYSATSLPLVENICLDIFKKMCPSIPNSKLQKIKWNIIGRIGMKDKFTFIQFYDSIFQDNLNSVYYWWSGALPSWCIVGCIVDVNIERIKIIELNSKRFNLIKNINLVIV